MGVTLGRDFDQHQNLVEKMKSSLLSLGVSSLLVFFVGSDAFSDEAAKTQRPNIILCMADDQGWSEVGFNGHDHITTPVMDEMARIGFRFDRFYSQAPNCGPTREIGRAHV